MSLFLIDKKTKRKLYGDSPSVSPKKTQLSEKGNIADDSPLVSHTKGKNLKRKLVEDSPLASHTKGKNLKRKLVEDSPPVPQKKTRKSSLDIEMSGK